MHLLGGEVVEEPVECALEIGSVDDLGVDHHRVAVKRSHGELSSCELTRQVSDVAVRGAAVLVQEDGAA